MLLASFVYEEGIVEIFRGHDLHLRCSELIFASAFTAVVAYLAGLLEVE